MVKAKQPKLGKYILIRCIKMKLCNSDSLHPNRGSKPIYYNTFTIEKALKKLLKTNEIAECSVSKIWDFAWIISILCPKMYFFDNNVFPQTVAHVLVILPLLQLTVFFLWILSIVFWTSLTVPILALIVYVKSSQTLEIFLAKTGLVNLKYICISTQTLTFFKAAPSA